MLLAIIEEAINQYTTSCLNKKFLHTIDSFFSKKKIPFFHLGPKNEWQKKYPEWGAFREHQVNILNQTDTLNAILFAHDKDIFEDIETLSFFKKFKGINV